MARQYPWVLAEVAWSDAQEFTRGTYEGLPLLSWGIAPRDKLATRRQLRAMGLRPGGREPVAILYFRCRRACKKVFARLFLIEGAAPVRPMTPARWAALGAAMAARRRCAQCREDAGTELPRTRRVCDPCRYSVGGLEPWDHLHDVVVGEPTLTAAEHGELDTSGRDGGAVAPVIWLHPPAAAGPAAVCAAERGEVA